MIKLLERKYYSMKSNKFFTRIFVSLLTVFLVILSVNIPVKAEEPPNEEVVETVEEQEDYDDYDYLSPEYDPAYNEAMMMSYEDEINLAEGNVSYTVIYDGNGATSGSTASTTHTYGDDSALALNGFKRYQTFQLLTVLL